MSWATRIRTLLAAGAIIGVVAVLLAGRDTRSTIEAVRDRGELVVAVRSGPASFYSDSFGPAGFEYTLAEGFAREIGARLTVVGVDSQQEGLDLVASGAADIAVGQAIDRPLAEGLASSLPIQSISQMVVCPRSAMPAEHSLGALVTDRQTLLVSAGSHHADHLAGLHKVQPALSWREIDGATDENLLGLVHAEKSGCAVIDADAWAFHRHLYPDLSVAAELPAPTLFGWVQARKGDGSLRTAANAYLARRQADGTVAALRERYFAHVESLTQVDGKRFYQAIQQRLPRYSAAFRREAQRNHIDWRLLAAVAYQESLWDPAAQSPTGVQGIMQLTLDTALQLGIDDRTDPLASIRGGARYLRQIIDALPADIPEADRTWMALAAYNAGIAHVLDARELTRKRGGNPDSWPEVRANLALLKQPQWYSKTRYGYARGATQAIVYVRHVRRYYDLLVLASNSDAHGGMMLAMGNSRQSVTN